jgi:hypothetical protein
MRRIKLVLAAASMALLLVAFAAPAIAKDSGNSRNWGNDNDRGNSWNTNNWNNDSNNWWWNNNWEWED